MRMPMTAKRTLIIPFHLLGLLWSTYKLTVAKLLYYSHNTYYTVNICACSHSNALAHTHHTATITHYHTNYHSLSHFYSRIQWNLGTYQSKSRATE